VLPFGTTMIIKAFYRGGGFLEANIVKSCKGGTIDIFDRMIRYQEVLLPPHKYKICSFQCLRRTIYGNNLSDKLTNPVFLVNILISIPFASQKGIFFRDDFAVKECCQCWKLFRKTFDLQVSTEITVFLVHML
ncbi:hypothetical protein ALC53_04261, partial [Atta colombica]